MTLLNPAKSINRSPLRPALLLIALALVLGSGGWLITPALATDLVGVGAYGDANSVTHGFVLKLPATFFFFTYLGATYMTLGGVNNRGLVCGDYVDVNNFRHGFIGRIR